MTNPNATATIKPRMINNAQKELDERKTLFQLLKEFFESLIKKNKQFNMFTNEMVSILDEVQQNGVLSLEAFNKLTGIVENQQELMNQIKDMIKEGEETQQKLSEVYQNLADIQETFKGYSLSDWKENYQVVQLGNKNEQLLMPYGSPQNEEVDDLRDDMAIKVGAGSYADLDPVSQKEIDSRVSHALNKPIYIAYTKSEEQGFVNAVIFDSEKNVARFCSTYNELFAIMGQNIENLDVDVESMNKLLDDTLTVPERDAVILDMMEVIPNMTPVSAEILEENYQDLSKRLEDAKLEADKNNAYIEKYGSINEEGKFELKENVKVEIPAEELQNQFEKEEHELDV